MQVMDNTVAHLKPSRGQRVFRARFSAITAPAILAAMGNLGEPNRNEALAVDARQELDLKVNAVGALLRSRPCVCTVMGAKPPCFIYLYIFFRQITFLWSMPL